MTKKGNKALGRWGEEQAALFLLRKGYKILERNFSVREAEIDIVATHTKSHHGQTLCFIEVKTRRADDGSAARATNYKKVQKLMHAGRAYCLRNKINIETTPIQFEHVSVCLDTLKKTVLCTIYPIPIE